MTVLLAVVIFGIGMAMLVKPDTWWRLTEHWGGYSTGAPTKFYLNVMRTGGAFFVIFGIFFIVLYIL